MSTTINLATALGVIWIHVLADFVLQSDEMARNKSGSNRWLTIHVIIYSVPFLAALGWGYAFTNFALHWITDYVSSRQTTRLWKAERRHAFFVVVGLDQAVHLTCLLATLPLARYWM